MATNKGESFRLKLLKVTQRFGFTLTRVRAAYRDSTGQNFAESRLTMKVLDAGNVSQRYQNIATDFNVGNNDDSNPDLKVLIYPAPVNNLSPDYDVSPIIREEDELIFNGYIHSVTRVDPLPIQDVNVYFSITTVRGRPTPIV